MLKVKNLTLLSKKKMKKGGNFDHGCKKKSSSALQWILKDADVYFKQSQHLKFEGILHSEKYMVLHNMLPSPYCVTRPQWVNANKAAAVGYHGPNAIFFIVWLLSR